MNVSDLQQLIAEMLSNLHGDYEFRPDNVYQEGCDHNRKVIGDLVEKFLLPGSRFENVESLVELRRRSLDGESCLLLAEHYSNFDYPVIFRMMENHPDLGKEAAESLLPIRGMKLSETDPAIAVYTRSYDSIVIYPSRTLDTIQNPAELARIRRISVPINHAAMREMITRKHHGRIITVFPAGTRYRPWAPDSRKGVREIHSYMKTFDNVVFLAINGNTLPPHESNNMGLDEAVDDLMILTASPVLRARSFRKEAEATAPPGTDPKQHVVDMVMARLEEMHNRIEPGRLKEKAALTGAS